MSNVSSNLAKQELFTKDIASCKEYSFVLSMAFFAAAIFFYP